ncbi:hypothetical protein BC834DRAFT_305688 [Gloeopeniophorella convolvens]|nr:hypothetical protein BC834DRAFT_305688 [Gloeopeniophorella convolvens]
MTAPCIVLGIWRHRRVPLERGVKFSGAARCYCGGRRCQRAVQVTSSGSRAGHVHALDFARHRQCTHIKKAHTRGSVHIYTLETQSSSISGRKCFDSQTEKKISRIVRIEPQTVLQAGLHPRTRMFSWSWPKKAWDCCDSASSFKGGVQPLSG